MFKGSYTVMVTPFKADGSLDEATLRKFVDCRSSRARRGSSHSAARASSYRRHGRSGGGSLLSSSSRLGSGCR